MFWRGGCIAVDTVLKICPFFVCYFHLQGALNISERTIPQPRMLQLSVEKLSREGAFLMDAGMVRFTGYIRRAVINPICSSLIAKLQCKAVGSYTTFLQHTDGDQIFWGSTVLFGFFFCCEEHFLLTTMCIQVLVTFSNPGSCSRISWIGRIPSSAQTWWPHTPI